MADLAAITVEAMQLLQKAVRESLAAQGHGGPDSRLSKSIDYTVKLSGNTAVGGLYFEDYGIYVELGVRASRIPYGGGKGKKGGKSEYIEGLIRFFKKKGLAERNATGAAFATAKAHKREGMPTRASARFSQTGKRTGFVRAGVTGSMDKLNDFLASKFAVAVAIEFEKTAFAQQVFSHEISI